MLSLNDAVQQIHVNAWVVSTLVGTVIPILVGLATKLAFRWKGLLMIILNGVQAFVVKSIVPDGGAVFTAQAVLSWVLGVVASIAMYHGLWKPLDVTSSTPTGKLAPQAGIGPNT